MSQKETFEAEPSAILPWWALGDDPKKFSDLEVVNTLDNIRRRIDAIANSLACSEDLSSRTEAVEGIGEILFDYTAQMKNLSEFIYHRLHASKGGEA